MKRKSLISIFVFACVFTAISNLNAQNVTNHKTKDEAKKSAKNGVTFKIPDKVMPMKWKDFKGMLMLSQKIPSGIFITYPEESESLADLKIRAEKSVAAQKILRDPIENLPALVVSRKTRYSNPES